MSSSSARVRSPAPTAARPQGPRPSGPLRAGSGSQCHPSGGPRLHRGAGPRTARSVSGRGVRSEERDVRRGCHPQQPHPVQGRRGPSTKSGSDAPRVTGQIKPDRSRRPERRGAPAAPNPLAVTSLHAQYRQTVATGPVATSLTEAEVWSALFAGSVPTEAQTHPFALCAITCPKALVRLYRDYERTQTSGSAQQLSQVGACGGRVQVVGRTEGEPHQIRQGGGSGPRAGGRRASRTLR